MSYFGNEWHLRDAEATASVLDTDIYRGLDSREVRLRRKKAGKNAIWHIKRISATDYALKNLGDLTSLLLLAVALTSAIFGADKSALAVCVILVLGFVLRVLSYVKARHILEKLSVEEIPSASVLRDGCVSAVRGDEIVCGDIVLLEAGDIAPCDGRIVSSGELRVSERGVTENRTSVIKRDTVIMTESSGVEIPCEYRVNMIFAGSAVLAGSCRMIATACGEDALVSMRRGGILIGSGDKFSAAERISEKCRIGNLVMLAGVMVISVIGALSAMIRGGDFGFATAFTDAVALAACSAFAYLSSAPYICAALAMRRAASDGGGRAVIKNADNIEKLSQVKNLIVADITAVKSGKAEFDSYLVGEKFVKVEHSADTSGARLLRLVRSVVCSSTDSSLFSKGGAESLSYRETLLSRLSVDAHDAHDTSEFGTVVDRLITSSVRGECNNTVVLHNGSYIFRLCGDIRDVLSYCASYTDNGCTYRITDEYRRRVFAAATGAEMRGGTVIAAAHRDSPYTTLKRLSTLTENMCFDGFIVIDEECESGIEKYTELFSDASMSLVLLSPSPNADLYYLKKAGLASGDIPIVQCRDVLSKMPLPRGSFIVSLPARSENHEKIDASAKLRLATVKVLTESLESTAVLTGEPAEAGMLSDPAIGFAIGRSKSRPIPQTLKRRADVSVYPEASPGYGGFAGAMKALSGAVCAVGNISRVVRFALTSQCARIACALLSVIFGIPAMNAASILLLGEIFDLAAVLVLSLSEKSGGFDSREDALPDTGRFLSFSATGSLVGVLSFAACTLTSLLTGNADSSLAALTSSLVLSQLVLLSELLLESRSLKTGGEGNAAYVFSAAVSLATVLLFAFSDGFCALFDAVPPTGASFTAGSLCAVVCLVLCELLKVKKRKK